MRLTQFWHSKTFWKITLVILSVIGVLLAIRLLPLREWIEAFVDWARNQGPMGMLLYGAVYILATVLCLWGALFTIGSGIAFGIWWGILVSWLSATTGAALAFLIARYLARDVVERWAQKNVKFRLIDDAIGQHGWKVVLLLRLNPIIPFNLSNYAYGLTRIRFWPYVLASMAGMLPGTALYTYLGHIGKVTLTETGGGLGGWQYAVLGGGLLILVAATVYLARLAQRALAEAGTPIAPAGSAR